MFESVALCVETKLGEVIIISVYLPPDKSLVNNDLLALTNFKEKTIIMGKTLLNFCLTKNIIIAAPEEATHFPKRGAPSSLSRSVLC